MQKKRPSIKKVNRDTYTLRADRDLFKALRYMFGNMNHLDFDDFCKDEKQIQQMEVLFKALAHADLRTPEEAKANMPDFMSPAGIANKLNTLQ